MDCVFISICIENAESTDCWRKIKVQFSDVEKFISLNLNWDYRLAFDFLSNRAIYDIIKFLWFLLILEMFTHGLCMYQYLHWKCSKHDCGSKIVVQFSHVQKFIALNLTLRLSFSFSFVIKSCYLWHHQIFVIFVYFGYVYTFIVLVSVFALKIETIVMLFIFYQIALFMMLWNFWGFC